MLNMFTKSVFCYRPPTSGDTLTVSHALNNSNSSYNVAIEEVSNGNEDD